MDLLIYPLLSVRSQKAIRRKWKTKGKYYSSPIWKPYFYTPRRNLVYRLSVQLKMTERQIRERIEEERIFILKHPQYFR